MHRRTLGLIVLAAALVMALIVPLALGPGLAGDGARAPVPAPPPVGSCLVEISSSPVSCDQPHRYEVIAAWPAGEMVTGGGECGAIAPDYIGDITWAAPFPWTLAAPQYDATFIEAPLTQRIGYLYWRACVLAPRPAMLYTGSIASTDDIQSVPGAFAYCTKGKPTAEELDPINTDLNYNLGCTASHRAETLATATGFLPDDPTADLSGAFSAEQQSPLVDDKTLQVQCQQIASDLLRTDDPSYFGQLSVNVVISELPFGVANAPSTNAESDAVSGLLQTATCSVELIGEGDLVSSLLGHGDAPLPLQPK